MPKRHIFLGSILALMTSVAIQASERATWLWKKGGDPLGASSMITAQSEQQTLIDLLQQQSIAVVYGSYGQYTSTHPQAVAQWNQTLATQGIQSHYLMAQNTWVFPNNHSKMLSKLQTRFIDYQHNAAPHAEFTALHLDIEPHALTEWKQGTPQSRQALLWQLIDTFKAIRAQLDNQGMAQLKLHADIPTWYDSSAKIDWPDQGAAFFAALSEVLDSNSIMAYERDNSTSILNATVTERALASSTFSVRLGVDVSETWENPTHLHQVIDELEAAQQRVDIHDATDYYYWLQAH
ncbi:hypothetical protein CWB99_17950 [Pseudoalteromonas rubra]|uniref:DUF4434 domain-containing protein n=1 Tax=Pseudoalteromonas rubra TaxID=43658 RepID=A0A5S3WHU0_9GAMM|nr:hypothetical protein [Pseudoalteromonas rubra]TMP26742.1 hypothetical protein CWB99_17950 [Pseudoalteromonas rubra]TMP30715.1 hypothetical protein CWC00_16180 [Pseudoalteromonas rubra]